MMLYSFISIYLQIYIFLVLNCKQLKFALDEEKYKKQNKKFLSLSKKVKSKIKL